VAGVVTLARAESVCSGAGVCAPTSTRLHSESQVAPPQEDVRRTLRATLSSPLLPPPHRIPSPLLSTSLVTVLCHWRHAWPFPREGGGDWAGVRVHTLSRVPHPWGATSCREVAPLTHLLASVQAHLALNVPEFLEPLPSLAQVRALCPSAPTCTLHSPHRAAQVSGSALRELVAPHGWGTRLGVWTRHAQPHQTPPLAREGTGVEVGASAFSPLLAVSHPGASPSFAGVPWSAHADVASLPEAVGLGCECMFRAPTGGLRESRWRLRQTSQRKCCSSRDDHWARRTRGVSWTPRGRRPSVRTRRSRRSPARASRRRRRQRRRRLYRNGACGSSAVSAIPSVEATLV
jgi:hypothetical protein